VPPGHCGILDSSVNSWGMALADQNEQFSYFAFPVAVLFFSLPLTIS